MKVYGRFQKISLRFRPYTFICVLFYRSCKVNGHVAQNEDIYLNAVYILRPFTFRPYTSTRKAPRKLNPSTKSLLEGNTNPIKVVLIRKSVSNIFIGFFITFKKVDSTEIKNVDEVNRLENGTMLKSDNVKNWNSSEDFTSISVWIISKLWRFFGVRIDGLRIITYRS